ncbi:guanylate binding protein 1, partial [Chelydra serpentina]
NVKTVKGGIPVNGRRFSSLVQSYVGTIRSGQVPCLDNAVSAMAAIENGAALGEALALYAAGMGGLRLPAELGELSAAHGTCEADALRLFMQRSFKDEEQGFQAQLLAGITERYANLLAENEAVSEQSCRALLEQLSAAMQQKLSAGIYSQPGGYQAYARDQNQVVENYRAKPNKGVKAEEALEQFLASKKAEAEAVLKADNLLTEAEKQVAEEKQRAEMLEQQRKAAEEKRLQTEQLMKDQERSHQEHVTQLEAKLTEELASARREAVRALESKLTEQEAMMQKGFEEKARLMEDEISGLRREISSASKTDFLLSLFSTIGDGLRAVASVSDYLTSRRLSGKGASNPGKTQRRK